MPDEFAKLTSALGVEMSEGELREAIIKIDDDGNGQIEVDEYLEWWGDKEILARWQEQEEQAAAAAEAAAAGVDSGADAGSLTGQRPSSAPETPRRSRGKLSPRSPTLDAMQGSDALDKQVSNGWGGDGDGDGDGDERRYAGRRDVAPSLEDIFEESVSGSRLGINATGGAGGGGGGRGNGGGGRGHRRRRTFSDSESLRSASRKSVAEWVLKSVEQVTKKPLPDISQAISRGIDNYQSDMEAGAGGGGGAQRLGGGRRAANVSRGRRRSFGSFGSIGSIAGSRPSTSGSLTGGGTRSDAESVRRTRQALHGAMRNLAVPPSFRSFMGSDAPGGGGGGNGSGKGEGGGGWEGGGSLLEGQFNGPHSDFGLAGGGRRGYGPGREGGGGAAAALDCVEQSHRAADASMLSVVDKLGWVSRGGDACVQSGGATAREGASRRRVGAGGRRGAPSASTAAATAGVCCKLKCKSFGLQCFEDFRKNIERRPSMLAREGGGRRDVAH
jgi:hypothetical protein